MWAAFWPASLSGPCWRRRRHRTALITPTKASLDSILRERGESLTTGENDGDRRCLLAILLLHGGPACVATATARSHAQTQDRRARGSTQLPCDPAGPPPGDDAAAWVSSGALHRHQRFRGSSSGDRDDG